jgi:hypothetical protein
MLIGHEDCDGSGGLRGQMPVDVVVIDDPHRDLAFRHGVHDLRAFLIDLRAGVFFQAFEEFLRPAVSDRGADDRDAGLEIFAARVGNGDFVFPLWGRQVEE